MGAPRIYELTEEQQFEAIEMALNCQPYRKIAKVLGFKHDTDLENYRKRNPLFEERLRTAREFGLEELAHSVLSLVDDYENPNQARAKFEAIKWYVGVMDPVKYGQKIDVNITQTIDISGAIERANERVAIDVTPKLNGIDDIT